MRIPRIYTSQPLQLTTAVALDDNAANHVARVLRLPIGAQIQLFNGAGGEYMSRITSMTKREVIVTIEQFNAHDVGSALTIHLGQVISRGERMDFTIQKAVELGATEITPLTSDFCNVKLQEERIDKKLAHWQGIIISACEQSGRTHIPTLHQPQSILTWIANCQAQHKLILEPTVTHSLNALSPTTDFALLIGGEGGFSDKEIQYAHTHHFTGVKLGPRILRTETAALAVIAALQTLFGDFTDDNHPAE
ncbi:MAG: 16S rRNA (uracil(1498)-N(3))-methyltransferase [Gammaproteobacteria bacterium]